MSEQNTILSGIAKSDPTMKQIAEDALGYAKDLSFKPPNRHVDYAAGAIRQDKIATNRTVEAAIQIMRVNPGRFEFDRDQDFIIKELEKLKK